MTTPQVKHFTDNHFLRSTLLVLKERVGSFRIHKYVLRNLCAALVCETVANSFLSMFCEALAKAKIAVQIF